MGEEVVHQTGLTHQRVKEGRSKLIRMRLKTGLERSPNLGKDQKEKAPVEKKLRFMRRVDASFHQAMQQLQHHSVASVYFSIAISLVLQ